MRVRVLVGLACLALTGALLAGYARIALVGSDQFANRATAALRDDSVRDADRRADHRRGGAAATRAT